MPEYKLVEKLIHDHDNKQLALTKSTEFLAKLMYKDFKNYLHLLSLSSNTDLSFFLNVVRASFSDVDDLPLIEEVIKPINMKEYYYDNRL